MEYLNAFVIACIGIVAAGFMTGLGLIIKWLLSVKKNISIMVDNGKNRVEENKIVFQILDLLMDSQGAQLHASKAILETVKGITENGNVDRAFRAIDEGNEAIKESKRIYKSMMIDKIDFHEIEEVQK